MNDNDSLSSETLQNSASHGWDRDRVSSSPELILDDSRYGLPEISANSFITNMGGGTLAGATRRSSRQDDDKLEPILPDQLFRAMRDQSVDPDAVKAGSINSEDEQVLPKMDPQEEVDLVTWLSIDQPAPYTQHLGGDPVSHGENQWRKRSPSRVEPGTSSEDEVEVGGKKKKRRKKVLPNEDEEDELKNIGEGTESGDPVGIGDPDAR
ncbi:hypothetical protein QFC21_006298 [Naganishia friedmannii]|uniref:Uncharacterized protein n=1 Tax=Naganishia friedmannii TaxID=89922 RepID=A0ACC2V3V8_9TREE|nr:hypothetical protein QFC21_006298 [Naganishia friedmannii]